MKISSEAPYERFPYEQILHERELQLVQPGKIDSINNLAFASSVNVEGQTVRTKQGDLEESIHTGRKKNSTYATHGLHRYKGKFYPQLAKSLINLSSAQGELIVDPFCGSGTVGLEAYLSGHDFVGIELSPLAAFVSRVKVEAMRAPMSQFAVMEKSLERLTREPALTSEWVSDEGVREELESWFAPRILERAQRVLGVIEGASMGGVGGSVAASVGRVCLSDLVREVSHQDPTDLRIRRRKEVLSDAPVEQMMLAKWRNATERLAAARRVVSPAYDLRHEVVCGDSAASSSWESIGPGSVAAVVTSPPYASALPYIDTDRLSLALVFGVSKSERRILEDNLVGSRELRSADVRSWLGVVKDGPGLPAETSRFLQDLAGAVEADSTAGFRKKQSPAVLVKYFTGISRILENSSIALRDGGHAWIVVGDSVTTIAGLKRPIETTKHVDLIAKSLGLRPVEELPITVTRENLRNSKNSITKNTILHYVKDCA